MLALHGYGLKNLYRHLNTVESPTVLVIKDMENHVFGAITSCPPRVSRHFCGNGQSAVFALCPDLKVTKCIFLDYEGKIMTLVGLTLRV